MLWVLPSQEGRWRAAVGAAAEAWGTYGCLLLFGQKAGLRSPPAHFLQRGYLPKVPQPPRTAPPAGDQVFKHVSL